MVAVRRSDVRQHGRSGRFALLDSPVSNYLIGVLVSQAVLLLALILALAKFYRREVVALVGPQRWYW